MRPISDENEGNIRTTGLGDAQYTEVGCCKSHIINQNKIGGRAIQSFQKQRYGFNVVERECKVGIVQRAANQVEVVLTFDQCQNANLVGFKIHTASISLLQSTSH